jgi:hypothetical protein
MKRGLLNLGAGVLTRSALPPANFPHLDLAGADRNESTARSV